VAWQSGPLWFSTFRKKKASKKRRIFFVLARFVCADSLLREKEKGKKNHSLSFVFTMLSSVRQALKPARASCTQRHSDDDTHTHNASLSRRCVHRSQANPHLATIMHCTLTGKVGNFGEAHGLRWVEFGVVSRIFIDSAIFLVYLFRSQIFIRQYSAGKHDPKKRMAYQWKQKQEVRSF
jgi:hypothetical protein